MPDDILPDLEGFYCWRSGNDEKQPVQVIYHSCGEGLLTPLVSEELLLQPVFFAT